MKPVENYKTFLKNNRTNLKPKGFDFDMDTFENLIDFFTPMDNIPLILRCSVSKLNNFCQECYNMNFEETYKYLSGITDMFMRGTFKTLASMGNSTAINTVAEHFMHLSNEQAKNGINITIVNDLKDDDEE